ncbi:MULTISPECIES: hypothetical protein [unclassified Pseudomonas]|uniref:hypothetical protein n=1 Tax=unclassified Pseudomonas TaxID=196821 RepID=UPI001CC19E70|nr:MULTISPECIES: hypothetical protein [unclassified Pseudomonas]
MIQRRRYYLSQISLRLVALRANVSQFKHDELSIQKALSGGQVPDSGQALDHAFDEIRESIDHTQALLEALAEATGDSEVVRMNNERQQENQRAGSLV